MRKFDPTAISAVSAIPAVGAGICKNRAGDRRQTAGGTRVDAPNFLCSL